MLMRKGFTSIAVLLLNFLLVSCLFIVFNALPIPSSLMLCTHPFAKTLFLALAVTLILNILIAVFWMKHRLVDLRVSLVLLTLASLLALWLGSYPHSPLGFSNRSNWILRGFVITRQGRPDELIPSGGTILVRAGSSTGITTLLADIPNTNCRWTSLNGGAWDEPGSCDTIYAAPQAYNDILTIGIQPGCSLPSARGQIKVSILP